MKNFILVIVAILFSVPILQAQIPLNENQFSGFLQYTTENEFIISSDDYLDDTLSVESFNADDNIDTIFNKIWVSPHWQNLSMTCFIFNADNNDTLELNYNWDITKWVPANKTEFTYVGDTQIYELYKIYNTQTSAFDTLENITITYSGTDTSTAYRVWVNSQWGNYINYVNYYHDTLQLLERGGSGTWWNNFEKEIALPVKGDTQLYYSFYWTGVSWDSTDKGIAYYDSNLNDTAFLWRDYINGVWQNDIKYTMQFNDLDQLTANQSFDYDTTTTSFVPSWEDFYYYSVYTGIEPLSINNEQLSVYPNPTSGEITLISPQSIDDIKVTNLLGQLVYESQPEQQQLTFELNKPGLYFVTLTSHNQSVTTKVIVSK